MLCDANERVAVQVRDACGGIVTIGDYRRCLRTLHSLDPRASGLCHMRVSLPLAAYREGRASMPVLADANRAVQGSGERFIVTAYCSQTLVDLCASEGL